MMRRRSPCDLHIEVSFILRESAFKNPCSDWARDLAAVPRGALYHHSHDIFRIIEWRETSKPGHVLFVATFRGLRSASFPSHHNVFQPRPTTRSSVLVDNFPEPFADKVDILRRNFSPQIEADSRRLCPDRLAMFV